MAMAKANGARNEGQQQQRIRIYEKKERNETKKSKKRRGESPCDMKVYAQQQ